MAVLCPAIAAASGVTAVVDRNRVGYGETVNLTVEVEGDDAEVDISVIKNFKVMSQGTSVSIQNINGNYSKKVRYNYRLTPRGEGAFLIPPLTVQQGGKAFKTASIRIQVASAADVPDAGRDIFVDAGVSVASPYIGQQLVYTFRLFQAVEIANAGLQQPGFEGFSAHEIKRGRPYRKIIDGREHQVTEVAYLLVPLKTGTLEIGPAVLTCDIFRPRKSRRRSSSMDRFFDGPLFGSTERQRIAMQTRPLTVTVRPLPPDTGGEVFSGLVGTFTLDGEVAGQDMVVGDSMTVTITIAGKGNLMDAGMPEITLPDGFKVYPDAPIDNIQLGPDGYSGEREFKLALVAVKPGEFTLPPVRLRYFDTDEGIYRTVSTPGFALQVKPGTQPDRLATADRRDAGASGAVDKKRVVFIDRDILALKEGLSAVENQAALPLWWFVAGLLTPALLVAGSTLILSRVRRDQSDRHRFVKIARASLKQAHDIAGTGPDRLALLNKALMAALSLRTGWHRETITYAEAADMLSGQGGAADLVQELVDLMKEIDSQRYGGAAGAASLDKQLLKRTERLVGRLMT
jgi:hypothetical protein